MSNIFCLLFKNNLAIGHKPPIRVLYFWIPNVWKTRKKTKIVATGQNVLYLWYVYYCKKGYVLRSQR